VGEAPSEGVRAGEVVDVRAAAGAVRAAIEEAEAQSGLAVQGVCAALSGAGVTGTPGRAAEPVTREGQVITPAEVRRALERAGSVALPRGSLKLHILPRAFAVDGAGPVRSPVGLSGAIIEAQVIVVSGSAFAAENLARAVRSAGRQIASLVAAPAALGLGALSDEERELGAVAIDFGAGLTAYAAWKDGGLHACGAIPAGGDLLTRDIAVGLGMGREEAEELKLGMSGSDGGRQADPPKRAAGVPGPEAAGLPEIVDARLEEMLLLVERRLAARDLASAFGAGVALAGAGARVAGLEEKARRVLGVPTRVARPRLAGVDGVDLTAPENALGTGLLRWSFDGAPRVETRQARWGTGWLASAVRWLAAGF
ncbi:MAG: cell division protein FtsA, partial [Planctomycetota bacterium]|jgi:cell division protein FtsA